MMTDFDTGELRMSDAATGTLLGTVDAANGGRRMAHSAITGETAEFGDYWTACQWLREKFPITPSAWPTGFAHHHYANASQIPDSPAE